MTSGTAKIDSKWHQDTEKSPHCTCIVLTCHLSCRARGCFEI